MSENVKDIIPTKGVGVNCVVRYQLSVFGFQTAIRFGLLVLNRTRDCLFSQFSLQIASVFFKEIYMEKSEFGDSSYRESALAIFSPRNFGSVLQFGGI